jgi:hypothetical protein
LDKFASVNAGLVGFAQAGGLDKIWALAITGLIQLPAASFERENWGFGIAVASSEFPAASAKAGSGV